MIQEALQYLAKLSNDSQRADFSVRDDRYVVVRRPDGEVRWVDAPPMPRRILTHSFGAFVAAAKHYSAQSIFHDTAQCVALLDDGTESDRLDRIVFPLNKSSVFLRLDNLSEGEVFSQRDFIALIRHELYGSVPDTLLPAVRIMDASSLGRGVSEVQSGRERGTREYVAELANAADIPEVFPVNFYYCDALIAICSASVVHCTLSYTLPPADVKFSLRVLPDELERAVARAQDELGESLRAELQGVPVFFGSP